eukprot:m.175338 g.175338  ORF g.175338 m.175338 type:complete len:210 (-) comp31812_c0_seq1:339-968(-)
MEKLQTNAAVARSVNIPQHVIGNYMSQSISDQEVALTKTLAAALVALSERADAMVKKVEFLESQCKDMKVVLHASMLAAGNKLPEVPVIKLESTQEIEGVSDDVSSDPVSEPPKRSEVFGFSPDLLAAMDGPDTTKYAVPTQSQSPSNTNGLESNNNSTHNTSAPTSPVSPTNMTKPSPFTLANKRSSTSDFAQLMQKLGSDDDLDTRF